MEVLLLKHASQMVDSALERGRALECHPLTVAVLDPGGHLLALKREDDSGILRPDIATAKAWGALGMGAGGRDLARRAATAPAFFEALSAISGGRIVVLSYHSLEDRVVKRVFAAGATSTAPPGFPVELPEHAPVLQLIGRGETPDAAELEANPRAASARLRAAEKLREPRCA